MLQFTLRNSGRLRWFRYFGPRLRHCCCRSKPTAFSEYSNFSNHNSVMAEPQVSQLQNALLQWLAFCLMKTFYSVLTTDSDIRCFTNYREDFLIADVDRLVVNCSLNYSGNWAPRLHWQLINASQTSSAVSERCSSRDGAVCQYQVYYYCVCSVCGSLYSYRGLAVWCSGNALVSINAVALHRARLVLGWVTAFRQVNCLIT